MPTPTPELSSSRQASPDLRVLVVSSHLRLWSGAAEHAAPTQLRGSKSMIARIFSLTLAWLGWGAMVVSDAYYVLTAAQAKPPELVSSDGDWIFPAMLLGASVLIVGWTVLLRWIYKRVLVGKRLSPDSVWSYVLLPVFGMLIWAPCGAVAVYGLVAFFSTGSFVWFFAFIAISCALLIVHMPLFLDPRRGGHCMQSSDVR